MTSDDASSSPTNTTDRAVRFWLVQVVGGVGVLGSYAAGLAAHPGSDALYGSMPNDVRSFYSVTMITAAVGYFPMMAYLLRHRRDARLGGMSGPALVDGLFAALLFPSILWMPATFAYLDGGASSTALWWLVRSTLVVVAFASYALVATILRFRPKDPLGVAAAIGSVLFTLQTGLLDPFVWPLYVEGSLLP